MDLFGHKLEQKICLREKTSINKLVYRRVERKGGGEGGISIDENYIIYIYIY